MVPLSSPIEEKLAWAEERYQACKDRLLEDEIIASLLARLKNAIYASHHEMQEAGIATICEECERNEGGSCCGAGLENRYDGWLLLVNLLLGGTLPKKRYDSKSCFFLGNTGCLLQARHVICVNYLCNKIANQVDAQKIAPLREKEGEELHILFILNERIKRRVKT